MLKRLITLFFLLLSGVCGASDIEELRPPPETILLRPAEEFCDNWKEIVRDVTAKEAFVECIPLGQIAKDYSDLLLVWYIDKSQWPATCIKSVEDIVSLFKCASSANYPSENITWNIIRKGKTDIIYEWMLNKSYGEKVPQHEILRCFLTKNGLHFVSITHRNELMSPDSRDMWISRLENAVSVVPFMDAATNLQGISLADRFQLSTNIKAVFPGWKMITYHAFKNGYVTTTRIPPQLVGASYISECLELSTIPNVAEQTTVDNVFKAEQAFLCKQASKQLEFRILKKTPQEVIYYYSRPQDHLQLNAVVRTFVTDQSYFSICIKRGLKNKMTDNEILGWKTKLETFKVRGAQPE